MKKRIVAIILSLVTALSLVTVFAIAASAGNVCSQISGSSARKSSFTVNTGSRWLFSDKITIKQEKGTMEYNGWFGALKSFSAYDTYTITVRKNSTGATKTYTLTGSSITIKLDKNSVYTVTVAPASLSTLQLRYFLKGALRWWKNYPTWSVTSTKGILSCN